MCWCWTTSLGQRESAQRDDLEALLTRTDHEVYSYLAEEVWSAQGEALSRFLVQTAILPELTPALCQAVTGDPEAKSLLERAYRQNLLRVGLGGAELSYRYHDLFRGFLLNKLAQEQPDTVLLQGWRVVGLRRDRVRHRHGL